MALSSIDALLIYNHANQCKHQLINFITNMNSAAANPRIKKEGKKVMTLLELSIRLRNTFNVLADPAPLPLWPNQ
jgi:hypothetical protein